MTLLFLGEKTNRLYQWLLNQDEPVAQQSEPLLAVPDCDFIVSYGYKHKVSREIIAAFDQRIVNLHISLLPWNRGADPNFWSWVEQTPKGVTIHRMDEGLDTGDILVQQEVQGFTDQETLASSYEKLSSLVEELFQTHYQDIRANRLEARPQSKAFGSYHRASEKIEIFSRLAFAWQTPVRELMQYAS